MTVAVRSNAAGSSGAIGIRQQLALRSDDDLIERRQRSLRRRVVAAHRFDDVADELEADRLRFGTPDRNRRRRRGRRTRRARRRDPQVRIRPARAARPVPAARFRGRARIEARRARAGRDRDSRGISARADATTMRAVPAASAMKRAGARGRDLKVRRQAAVRIDFLRRERQHLPFDIRLGQALQARQKEPRVGRHPLDVGVGRRHEHDRRVLREDRDMKGRGRRRESGDSRGTPPQPRADRARFQERAEGQRRGRGQHLIRDGYSHTCIGNRVIGNRQWQEWTIGGTAGTTTHERQAGNRGHRQSKGRSEIEQWTIGGSPGRGRRGSTKRGRPERSVRESAASTLPTRMTSAIWTQTSSLSVPDPRE